MAFDDVVTGPAAGMNACLHKEFPFLVRGPQYLERQSARFDFMQGGKGPLQRSAVWRPQTCIAAPPLKFQL